MTILPAGDLLAVVRYELPTGIDFTIERVTAIAVPDTDDTDTYLTRYFIEGTGWVTRESPFSQIAAVAAPANIVAVTEHCLKIWRGELGTLDGLAPWITDTQVDHWLEAWVDEEATR